MPFDNNSLNLTLDVVLVYSRIHKVRGLVVQSQFSERLDKCLVSSESQAFWKSTKFGTQGDSHRFLNVKMVIPFSICPVHDFDFLNQAGAPYAEDQLNLVGNQ